VEARSQVAVADAVAQTVRPAAGELRRAQRTKWLSSETAFHTALAGLALLVVATRVPFMTSTLYAFDSANYALAVRDFYNVAFHQPHPPGYPLYVFIARAINFAIGDANRALILEGIGWSMLAVVSTGLLGRAIFGRGLGLLAAGLLVTTVGFWGYGEVAYPYVALAGEAATLAWLAHSVLQGRRQRVIWLGLAWAIALGVRWDGAVFCTPLWLWALWAASRWGMRLASVALAAAITMAWAVPMVVLTGGWDAYRQALASYLQVWSAQSAYVVGDFSSGGETQATYNLNFLVNYLRQMLGVGLVLVLYVVGRRFGPSRLASDQRSRFVLVWILPPLLVYVFAHLGEPGYVLSLAPQAGVLIALAIVDLRSEAELAGRVLAARGWRIPGLGTTVAVLLTLGIVSWNAQAFVRGVGPGRLPDLQAHDATTSAQVDFLSQQPPSTTYVLAHDILRQLDFYRPGPKVELLYSEYVPDFQNVHLRTELPAGTEQMVVLDGPVQGANAKEVVLRDQPRVSVWVVDVRGAHAVIHGYHYVSVE
jgi:hypothetical protein